MNISLIRVLTFIVIFALVIVLPWWVSIFLLAGLTIYFPLYLEILFFGFLFDTLYSARYEFPFVGLTLAAVFLLMVMTVKPLIRT